MKIRTKLHLIAILPVGLMLVVGGILLWTSQRLDRAVAQQRLATQVMQGVFELNILTYEYHQHHAARAKEQWEDRHRSLGRLLTAARYKSIADLALLRQARECHRELGALFGEITQTDAGLESALELHRLQLGQLLTKSHSLVALASQLSRSSEEEWLETQQQSNRLLLLVIATLVVVLAVVLSAMAQSITRPVLALQRRVEQLGRGQLDQPGGSPAADEVGDLARAFDDMTQKLRTVTVSRDELAAEIAGRKQIEEELKLFFDVSIDMLCLANFEGRFTKLSPTWSKVLGWSEAELLAQPFLEFVHPDDRATTRQAAEQLSHGEPVIGFDNRYRRADGTYRWLSWNSIAVPGRGMIVAAARDITERKQVAEALAQERNLLRSIIDNLPDNIYVKDTDGRLLQDNLSHCQMLGVKRLEDVLGKTVFDFFPQEEAEQFFADEQQVMRSGQALINREEERMAPSGRKEWVLTTKVPLRGPDGSVTGMVGITRDITELKLAEQALARKAAELARSNRELEMFAYAASHDLQEPLRAVSGFVQLLQKRYEGQLDERADEYIHFAVDGALRMQALINGLLEYSRVGRRDQPFTPIDCNAVLNRALQNLQLAIRESSAVVTHDDLPTLLGDTAELTQLFQNLVSNALKYRRTDPPQVHVGAVRQTAGWQFAVRDNGIGIDPNEAKRLFVIFQRLHTRKEYPGTGLGLAICKKIVERHGGRIWLESAPGEGATFFFDIPDKGDNGL